MPAMVNIALPFLLFFISSNKKRKNMLQNKNAIIYGAGGSLGGAVAKAFAAAGATVFLTGRNLAPVQKTANEILASGGKAEAWQVDAMDEAAVNDYISK